MLTYRFFFVVLAVMASSTILTGLMRRYALSRSMLDHPNVRSSHVEPTPRGGGVAVAASFLAGLLLMSDETSFNVIMALLVAGCTVTVVGFIDDRGDVPALWRLMVHFACAGWILHWIGVPKLEWLGNTLDLGISGGILALLYLVWMLNLYNFMDGIDGIAGTEAVTVCIAAAVICWFTDQAEPDLAVVPILLAAASSGFLLWNFPPAKIFMGDAGSGFLGLTLAAISLRAADANPVLIWSWLTLFGVFVVDTGVTLMRRLLRGKRAYEAHRSHAYQYASRLFGAHQPVTLGVAAINVLWLTPWALAISLGRISGAIGIIIAYLPLVILAFRFRAGLQDTEE